MSPEGDHGTTVLTEPQCSQRVSHLPPIPPAAQTASDVYLTVGERRRRRRHHTLGYSENQSTLEARTGWGGLVLPVCGLECHG